MVGNGPSGEFPVRVGVALGAGSAAAMAEIGALEVLVESGVPVHCVAGTSAGAVVGAAFAAGRVSQLREALAGLSRRGVMRLFDPAWPREGFLHGRRALEFIRPHLGESIEALALPYAAVATDLRTGDEVILDRGSVFDAVRASIAIPGIFTPWRVGGRLLVDGGLVNPVPVSAARALGAEFVIALNVLPLRTEPRPVRSVRDLLRPVRAADPPAPEADARDLDERLGLVEVVWQASRILASQVASHRLRQDPPGHLLQIPLPEIGMFEVHRTGELAELGRRCAERALPELRSALARAVPLGRRLREWPRRASARWAAPRPGARNPG
jgi:NTE family protein